jgi:bifunctional non-homologous end joining protein LigD
LQQVFLRSLKNNQTEQNATRLVEFFGGIRFLFALLARSPVHHIYMRPPRMDTAQLTLVREPFDHPDYLFELKHDGFRALAYISEGHCELVSRRRNAYKSFAELRANLGALKVKDAVINGELVCLDSEGRSIFNELLFRRGSPIFYVFDLLYLNGRDLRQLPLIERKEKLRAVIEKSALPDVLCGKYVEGRGVDLYNEVVRRNLEGVVAKRKNGIYTTVSGWLKVKNPQYTQSERRYELFESFKANQGKRELTAIPKKPPLRAVPLQRKKTAKHRAR